MRARCVWGLEARGEEKEGAASQRWSRDTYAAESEISKRAAIDVDILDPCQPHCSRNANKLSSRVVWSNRVVVPRLKVDESTRAGPCAHCLRAVESNCFTSSSSCQRLRSVGIISSETDVHFMQSSGQKIAHLITNVHV